MRLRTNHASSWKPLVFSAELRRNRIEERRRRWSLKVVYLSWKTLAIKIPCTVFFQAAKERYVTSSKNCFLFPNALPLLLPRAWLQHQQVIFLLRIFLWERETIVIKMYRLWPQSVEPSRPPPLFKGMDMRRRVTTKLSAFILAHKSREERGNTY